MQRRIRKHRIKPYRREQYEDSRDKLSFKQAGKLFHAVGSTLVDVIFPPRCAVCGMILPLKEEMICRKCAADLPFVGSTYCLKCGKPIDNSEREYCSDCETHPHRYEEGRAALLYEKGARRAIDRLKFYNRRESVPFFGVCLSMLAAEYFPRWKPDCLVPVPMHPKKRAERGFDQAALLAEELGRRTGVEVREDLLIRQRYTGASKKLGRASRRKNLRGVFAVNDDADIPFSVVLIDDIYTTGATMDEAGYALQKAGVRHIFFLTVCIGRGQT